MSFGSTKQTPAPPQKPLGQDLHKASTSEQARPVPYVAGLQRVGLTFISDVFDEVATAVTQSIGKKKSVAGYNYFASFAALVCAGPLRGFHGLYFNGDAVYTAAQKLFAASLTVSSTTVTFYSTAAHGLTTGDTVFVAGVDQPEYNGAFGITVTSSTTFTYLLPEAPLLPPTAAGGYITATVQLDPVFRDGAHPDYVDILIPDFCELRLYWGTETQGADPYLNTSGVAHPAYRGLAYFVFTRLFTGFNQTSIQNVEAVVSRVPEADWHTLDHINDDANLAAIVADVLQHPRIGLGVPDARMNTAEIIATGSQIDDERFGLSPLVLRTQNAKEVLLALIEYADAYPTANGGGLFGLRLARPNYTGMVALTDADFVSVPAFTADDWSTVITETNLKFTNRDYGFTAFPVRYRDAAARQIVEEPNELSLDRSYITRLVVAEAAAASVGRAAALPKLEGRVRLRRRGTLLDDLQPGSLFTMAFSRRDLSGLIFRVQELAIPSPQTPEIEITFNLDRSYLYQSVAFVAQPTSSIQGNDAPIFGEGVPIYG